MCYFSLKTTRRYIVFFTTNTFLHSPLKAPKGMFVGFHFNKNIIIFVITCGPQRDLPEGLPHEPEWTPEDKNRKTAVAMCIYAVVVLFMALQVPSVGFFFETSSNFADSLLQPTSPAEGLWSNSNNREEEKEEWTWPPISTQPKVKKCTEPSRPRIYIYIIYFTHITYTRAHK